MNRNIEATKRIGTGLAFIGSPDGAEIINLSAGILMSVALIPYGVKLIGSKNELVPNKA